MIGGEIRWWGPLAAVGVFFAAMWLVTALAG
jgi:hypothetical protein